MTASEPVDVCSHLPPGPRLLILDGNNIVRRVYEARRGAPPEERLTGSLSASMASIRRALREIRPTHAIAAFDYGGNTWRHEQFPGYTKGREPMASGLRDALPGFRDAVTDELGVRCLAVQGLEADDVIATVAMRWSEAGHGSCVVCSTDKDVLTLLPYGVNVRDHFARCWLDAAYVEAKFGVAPSQLRDYLALRGDKSDGVPGVPGVGPATAVDLLKRFGTLEACLEQARIIPGQPGRRLREGRREAERSLALVSFKTDVPLGLTWSALRVAPAWH